MVTPESIEAGLDRELSRVMQGGRAFLFLRTQEGSLGLASCKLTSEGKIERVFGVYFVAAHRISELDAAVVAARREFDRVA